jgi:hypothetical protein
MQTDTSRYELNREVRRILVRHAVDLTELQFSCSRETVYLFGRLVRDTAATAFTPVEVEALAQEIYHLRQVRDVRFDLNNWNLVIEPGYTQARARD